MPQQKKKSARPWLRWLLLLIIPAIWCTLHHFGVLSDLENQMLKMRYRARGEIATPVKIFYVDVDTRAIQQMGERPWNRADFAVASKALFDVGGAKAIGFDFVFSNYLASKMVPREELAKGNWAFAKVIHDHPGIVLAAQYSGGQALAQEGKREFPLLRKGFVDRTKNDVPELPEDPLLRAGLWGTVGLIDVDYDYGGDEVPRWVPLFADTSGVGVTFYNLSVELVLAELGLDESALHRTDDALTIVRPDGTVAAELPLREKQLLEVNWFSRWENPDLNPRESMADVLLYQRELTDEKPEVRKEAEDFFKQFKGAIVLVGPVDPLLQDLAPTPFDNAPVPKVGLHGNLIKTILSGRFIRRLPEPVDYVITFLLTIGIAALCVTGGTRSVRYKFFAGVLMLAYVAYALILFKNQDLVLPLAMPIGSVFTASFGAIIWQLLDEEKQKGVIKGMFSTYVSPQLVENMVESGAVPQLGGHDAEITAYFSDIQSFSTFAEKMESGPLVELMNEYLTACTDIVFAQGGALDKYIGDAVVAMFGGLVPLKDHAYRACVASQLVQRRLGELRQKWRKEGEKWPNIVWQMQTRIGLNSGRTTVGNMGSNARFNYTMMGDNVNLGARMESGAKAYGVYTMVTEATKQGCEQFGGDRVVFRYLDKLVVKGRTRPVPIYEIMGLKEDVTQQTYDCLEQFASGMALYLSQDWDAAELKFQRSAELEPNQPWKTPGVENNPSHTMLARVRFMRANPPGPGWAGVYELKEK